jgi:SAM-dependent methyltransferase
MPPEVTNARWQLAQRYEADWWLSYKEGFDAGYLKKYAADIEQEVSGHASGITAGDVLETGGGPVGIAPFLRASRRVVTDPLHDLFEGERAYADLRAAARARGAEYVQAKGEDLPFEPSSFDLYVSDNVIDHAESPDLFLSEAYRVLRPGGLAYLRVHVYHTWGRLMRGGLELLTVDRGHPHTFSSASIEGLAQAQGFQVVSSGRESFLDGWKKDWRRARSGQKKALVQALLLVTRADHTLILRKPAEQ